MLIAIPATRQHRPVVEASLRQLARLYPGAELLIVTPEPKDYANLATEHLRVEADRVHEPLAKAEVAALLGPDKARRAGWYYQQLLKYAIVLNSDAEQTLILDADTVLLRAFKDPRCFPSTKEDNPAYFAHYEALTGQKRTLSRSAIANFMLFERHVLSGLLSAVEAKHQETWAHAILRIAARLPGGETFSEYETYANWHHAAHPEVKQTPLRIFRRGDLLMKSPSDCSQWIEAAGRKHYDAIAFELAHQGGSIKTLAARAILLLGLSPW